MKTIKKLLALVLAIAVCASLALPAFADDPATVTIKFPTSTDYENHQYEVYQIFTGEVDDTTLTSLKYGANANGTTGDAVSADDLATIADISTSASDQEKLATILTLAKLSSPVATLTKTSSSYTGAPGYYLIKDKDTTLANAEDDSYTLYLLEVVGDEATISPKASVPQVVKKVDDVNDSTGASATSQDSADYDIGDYVPYTLTATLASNVSNYKKYHITFVDTLEAGKFDAISDLTIKVDGTDISTGTFTGYTVTKTVVTAPTASGFEVKLEFVPTGDATTLPTTLNGKNVTVEFSAQLGKNANIGADGNVNTVQLKYSNNPNDSTGGEEGKTPEDTVIVFTYEIIVNKVDENGDALKGATFALYKKYDSKKKNANGDELNYDTVTDADGNTLTAYNKHYLVKSYTLDTNDPDTTFSFSGLDDGEYVLVETNVPANYNAIDPIVINVTGTHTATAKALSKTTKKDGDAWVLTGLTGTATGVTFTPGETSGKLDGTLSADIENKSGIELPETGGIGTTIFYVTGAVLALGAGILLVTKKRMSR